MVAPCGESLRQISLAETTTPTSTNGSQLSCAPECPELGEAFTVQAPEMIIVIMIQAEIPRFIRAIVCMPIFDSSTMSFRRYERLNCSISAPPDTRLSVSGTRGVNDKGRTRPSQQFNRKGVSDVRSIQKDDFDRGLGGRSR